MEEPILEFCKDFCPCRACGGSGLWIDPTEPRNYSSTEPYPLCDICEGTGANVKALEKLEELVGIKDSGKRVRMSFGVKLVDEGDNDFRNRFSTYGEYYNMELDVDAETGEGTVKLIKP